MPYKLKRKPSTNLYWVVNAITGRHMSKDPMPYQRALAQMRALYVHVKD